VRAPKPLLIVRLFTTRWALFHVGLAKLFLPDSRADDGAVLYRLAPCIAMVILTCWLRGNTPLALVCQCQLIAQMISSVYANLLIGEVHFDVLAGGGERRVVSRAPAAARRS